MKRLQLAFAALPIVLIASCGKPSICALNDDDCDGVPDDLGRAVERDGVEGPDQWDVDGDGKGDGVAVDLDCDNKPDALGLDTNGDGFVDSIDINPKGDTPDIIKTGSDRAIYDNCDADVGAGGTDSGSGGSGSGGNPLSFDTGGTMNDQGGGCLLGTGSPAPGATTTNRYAEANLVRDGVNYMFIANGWGPGFQNHTIKYTTQGTAFEVVSFNGNEGSNYEPAGYPTVFCGQYSNPVKTSGTCGLPRAVSSITSMQTGLRWSQPAINGTYNVAYDVWLSNNGTHSGYFMVWYRDPPGHQPAGSVRAQQVTVAGVPGVWNIWVGTVFNRPITNYVRAEGSDTRELAFDMMDFFDDSVARGFPIPGTEVMSVAIGFEIWNGPVTNLKVEDFCVNVQ